MIFYHMKGIQMRALVTGGSGFIGSEVVKLLIERGDAEVSIFQRSGLPPKLEPYADKIQCYRGSVGNYSHVLNAVQQSRPDILFHLGAMLSVPSEADHSTSIQTNAVGTFYVLEAARLFNVKKTIFASTLATFGLDIQEPVIGDASVQRPTLIYGATKVFGELLGHFYRRKFDMDVRGLRYPSVVGPGVTNPGIVQYTSWVIEESAKGNPFSIWLKPETRQPIVYYKDAALGTIQLAEAPREAIQTVYYLIDGAKPTPSAQQIADAVRKRLPSADIRFEVDETLQATIDQFLRPIDDSRAREEWGWHPKYDLDGMVDDFIAECSRAAETD